MTDRRLRCRPARVLRHCRRSTLRKGLRTADQATSAAIDRIIFRIMVLPFSLLFYRAGTSMVPQLRRPWAAQSCTFRTSAMVLSNQIPAATSTAKKPSITAFSNARLPSSSGGSAFRLAFLRHRLITASADRDERHRNSRRYDTAFPRIVHIPRKLHATNNSGRPAPFRGRREYRGHNPAGTARKPVPASSASVPAPAAIVVRRCAVPGARSPWCR